MQTCDLTLLVREDALKRAARSDVRRHCQTESVSLLILWASEPEPRLH